MLADRLGHPGDGHLLPRASRLPCFLANEELGSRSILSRGSGDDTWFVLCFASVPVLVSQRQRASDGRGRSLL